MSIYTDFSICERVVRCCCHKLPVYIRFQRISTDFEIELMIYSLGRRSHFAGMSQYSFLSVHSLSDRYVLNNFVIGHIVIVVAVHISGNQSGSILPSIYLDHGFHAVIAPCTLPGDGLGAALVRVIGQIHFRASVCNNAKFAPAVYHCPPVSLPVIKMDTTRATDTLGGSVVSYKIASQ